MKYYYFRVSGTIALEMYVSEEELRHNGAAVAPTEEAMRELTKEIEALIDNAYPVLSLNLDQAEFQRVDETE